MNVQQQREEIKKYYSSPSWTKKVNNMDDAQVTAIYLRLKGEGKI